MSDPLPFVRSSGRGPAVLCLHSSGSSSRQWDALASRLGNRYRVLAADLVGHGKSAGWREGEEPSLEREAERLAPILEAEAGDVHLVGHSYGAAVAVKLALALPGRVRSLCLYEPVKFRLLLDAPEPDPAGREIVAAAGEMQEALDAGRGEDSARRFVDYWSGPGTFARIDRPQRAALAARMPVVMGCFTALFHDRTRRSELERLDVPALLMAGTRSPAPARGVVEHLARALPRSHRQQFHGLGHMAPVTHPEAVNAAIESFLGEGRQRESIMMRTFCRPLCPATILPLPQPAS